MGHPVLSIFIAAEERRPGCRHYRLPQGKKKTKDNKVHEKNMKKKIIKQYREGNLRFEA